MDSIAAGMIIAEMRNTSNKNENDIREALIQEMRDIGMLLPQYDWSDKDFNDTLEAITADWFERHPETQRGTGEFQKKYPEKIAGLELLEKMGAMGRITPDEFITLYREIHNF